ncbi:MAG: homocysteine S-methyltransferase family protein, partial [Propionibacteriaceae bacterium]|nr:homocysteine S-methyltransferase family protein [Propionibacteriaceae bacterium]
MTDNRRPLPDAGAGLRAHWGRRVLVADGAMGTMVQAAGLDESAYAGYDGCVEILNVTRPEAIAAIHAAYLEAGADLIGTNTFGANLTALAEYGLIGRLEELALAGAKLARAAADAAASPGRPRFVLGSMGPGTKLATLGQVAYADLRDAYQAAAGALVAGGVDALLIETCQDLLQAKAAVAGAKRARAAAGGDQPIIVHVTIETTGAMLIGSDVSAVVATLVPLGVDGLGFNCATGPAEMAEPLRQLARHAPVPISAMPNAGLPELTPAGAVYPLGPTRFAAQVAGLADDCGLAVVGGCCGTTPDHIRALAAAWAEGAAPAGQVAGAAGAATA